MSGFNLMGFAELGNIYRAEMWKVSFYSLYLNGLRSCENYFYDLCAFVFVFLF